MNMDAIVLVYYSLPFCIHHTHTFLHKQAIKQIKSMNSEAKSIKMTIIYSLNHTSGGAHGTSIRRAKKGK